MINQYTPSAQKMAPSKAFTVSDSKAWKDGSSPGNKLKTMRSRNTDTGKQTVDHNAHKSAKWVDEKTALTLKKVSDGGKNIQTKSSDQNNQSKRQQ